MKTIICKNNHGKVVKLPLSKFIFRPGAYAVIINDEKEILFVQNKSGKIWFPGGGIEIGETIEYALKREVREETNIKNLKIQKLLGLFENFWYFQDANNAWQSYFFFYLCKISKNEKIIRGFADQYEEIGIDKLIWIKIKDIKKEMFCDLNSEVYKMLKKLL